MTRLMVRAQAHLVAPVNFGISPLGLLANRWIFFFEPTIRSMTAWVNRCLNTMNRSVPRLVIVEIMLQLNRWPVPGTTGVLPRLESLRPA